MADRWKKTQFKGKPGAANRALLDENTPISAFGIVRGPMFNWAQRGRDLSAEGIYRDQVRGMAATMSGVESQKYSEWLKHYPTMDPRTVVPLALGNIEPLSLIGQQAASADIAARIQDGSYGMNKEATAAALGGGMAQQPTPDPMTEDSGDQAWWQTVADNLVPDDLSPQSASRWLLAGLQSGRDAWEGAVRTGEGNQKNISDVADEFGLDERQRNWLEAQASKEKWGTQNLTGTQDDRQRSIYEGFDPEAKKKVDEALAAWKQTDLSTVEKSNESLVKQTAIGQVLTDPAINQQMQTDTGSWLPPHSIEVAKQKAAESAWDIRTPDDIARGISPQAWTPGRQVARTMYAPDEQAYHTLSGFVDAANALVLDPVNLIPLGGAGKIVDAAATGLEAAGAAGVAARLPGGLRRAIQDETPAVVQTNTQASQAIPATRRGLATTQAARQAGAQVFDDGRFNNAPFGQYVVTQRAWDYLKTGRGARMVDDLTNDMSASSIWMKTGQRIDYTIAEELARASTPEATRAVMGTYLGKEIDAASDLGTLGSSIPGIFKFGGERTSRLPGAVGDRSVHWQNRMWRAATNGARGKAVALDDSNALATELHAIAIGAGATPAEIAPFLDSALVGGPGVDRYEAIYGAGGFLQKTVVPALVRNGVEESDASRLVTAYDGGLDGAMRDHWNSNVAFGGGPSRGAATLMGEDLGNVAVLPSYREILRAGSKMRAIRAAMPGDSSVDSVVGDALDEMTSIWRKNVLVRPAYALREIGEMAFSMSLSGYDSYFTHPIQIIALASNVAAQKAMAGAAGHLSKALLTGSIDDSVKAGLRAERLEARSSATLGGRAGRTAVWAGKQAALRGAQPIGKTVGALAMLSGLRTLAPAMDQNMARVTGDGMFDELERFADTGDPSHITAIGDSLSTIHGNFYIDTYSTNYAASAVAISRPIAGESGDHYARALADRLRRGSVDKTIRDIADPNVAFPDVVADYTMNRAAQTRQMMGNSRTMKEWADPAVKTDEDFVRAQQEVVQQFTNNDPELLDALRTGMFRGKPVDANNRALVAHIKKTVEKDPNGFPETMTSMDPKAPGRNANAVTASLDKFNTVSNEFFESVGEFSDIFARGPLVRQAYVKRVKELGVHMSPAAKAEIVKNLRQAGDLDLARSVQQIKATGSLDMETVDLIAARFAKKESERIFYDAAKRQNWAYAFRVVAPFAQATANTFKRWGMLSMENPQMYYRSLKPLMALQQPGSAALYGAYDSLPGDQGAIGDLFDPERPEESAADGFFYTDRYGERKFAYPLVGAFAQMFGADSSTWLAEGSAENLNIAGTTVNPGFGPMMTFPASFVLGDVQHDQSVVGDIVRQAFPYGLSESDSSIVDKFIDSFGNTFQRKAIESSNQERRANFTMMNVAALAKSGDYDLSDQSEVSRMNNDAAELTDSMMRMTYVLGMFTPSTFNPKILAEVDTPGAQAAVTKFMLLDKLGAEYQKYTAEDFKGGTLKFVEDYGQTALFGALPRTKTAEGAAIQATNDMWKFATDNPDSYRDNLRVIGLFMSSDDLGSNFAREQYSRQKATGQRQVMTAEEYTTKVNEAIGWMLWNQKTKEITQQFGDGTPEASSARAVVRDELESKYPGFSPSAKDTGKIEETIKGIEDALDDEAISTLPSHFYVKRYMEARTAARSMLQERGGTGNLNAKGNADVAAALRGIGDQYARQDTSGGFRNMWNRILTQELYDPTVGEN